MKKVRKTLSNKIPKLLGVHLLSNTFKVKLAEIFCKHYGNILKKGQSFEAIVKPQWKAIKELLVFQYIDHEGANNVVDDIKLLAKVNNWPANRRSEIIRNIKDISKHPSYYMPNKYVAELDTKFHDTLSNVMPNI